MATLTRWDPFREMMALRSTMDRLFDDSMRMSSQGASENVFSLPIDVSEDETEYVVEASVPGIPLNAIELTIENNVLTISGQHSSESERKDANYVVRERHAGQFRRSITLPTSIDEEKITAESNNGVLSIHVPKSEKAKPKRIQVKGVNEIEAKAEE